MSLLNSLARLASSISMLTLVITKNKVPAIFCLIFTSISLGITIGEMSKKVSKG